MLGSTESTPAVEFRGVSRVYGSCRANDCVSFAVRRGTVHALVGENGAGKTTAMKLLFGMTTPTSGEILVGGAAYRPASPVDAVAHGIGMVHQHFMLSDTETALDNLLLAVESVRRTRVPGANALRLLARGGALAKAQSLVAEFGLSVDLLALVENLSVGEQQRLEILKLLFLDADILILDEPTAVLTPQETEALYRNLEHLTSRGKTVILVTHKLREVLGHAQAITVLRQGKVVANIAPADTNEAGLAALMVGRAVELNLRDAPRTPAPGPNVTPLLTVEGITLAHPHGTGAKPLLKSVSLAVRPGEILGIAGVEGNGQSALLSLLSSPLALREAARAANPNARLLMLGRDAFEEGLDARSLRALSFGLVPEDRLAQGLLPEASVEENFLLGRQRRPEFARFGFLRRKAIRASARASVEAFDVRPRNTEIRAGGLSGGNQQKLILAREMALSPRLLIVSQPTRGVDVGAVEALHRKLLDARNAGVAILLFSSELDEILSLSDRVSVFFEGEIVGTFTAAEADEASIGLCMGGRRRSA